MKTDPRSALLDELSKQLENALALFDESGDPSPAQVETVSTRMAEAFRVLHATNESLEDRTLTPDLQEKLDHARRLQAVLISLATREQESMGQELSRLVDVRKRLAARDVSPATGESCDVSG